MGAQPAFICHRLRVTQDKTSIFITLNEIENLLYLYHYKVYFPITQNYGVRHFRNCSMRVEGDLRIAFTRNYFNMQIRKCEVELCFDVVGKVGYADVFFKLMAVRD